MAYSWETLVYYHENEILKDYLTIGKEYLTTCDDKYVSLINDQNQHRRYYRKYFITLDEYREIKIKDVLND
jgi:hypothetical protein